MLAPDQIIFIGILASVITFLLRVAATYGNIGLSRIVVNILLFLVSGGLAIVWTKPQLPPFTGDIAGWVVAFFTLAMPIVGFASLIYNLLYEKVVVPAWARLAKTA